MECGIRIPSHGPMAAPEHIASLAGLPPPFAMPSLRGTLDGSIQIHPARPVQVAMGRLTPCCAPLRQASAKRWGRSQRREPPAEACVGASG
jgi:hypothetical protein